MKVIKLKLPKDTSGVAGFKYGEQIYKEQVKANYDMSDKLTIEFPDNIERVGSSFIQGLFSEIIMSKGFRFIEENIVIKSKSAELTRRILNRIE